MEVRYKKDMNHNYIILEYPDIEGYELDMMLNNKINGLLSGRTCSFNGCNELYYDISSKQPLSRMYLKKELNLEDVRTIILSIQLLLNEMRRYLMSSNNILFDAEYCFCNPENCKPEWIFYPSEEKEHGLRNLAEFMMDRVNHTDKKAVDMVYRFYKLMKAEMLNRKELGLLLEEFVPEDVENIVTEESSKPKYSDCGQDNMDLYEDVDIPHQNGQKERTIWSDVTNKIEKIKNSILSEIGNKKGSCIKGVKESTTTDRKQINKGDLGAKGIDKFALSEWEHYGLEYTDNYKGETVVMGVQNRTAQRRLRSLDHKNDEYIILNNLPCILGKMKECVDVVLKDPSISRMHAKIYEENGELYVQDLNSTNGSYVNHLELEGDESVRLKIGDELKIGNLRYIYE